jgi:succinoglycan biosynthesis protein ExoO
VRFADRAGAVIGAPPLEDLARRMLGRAVTPLIIDYWKRYPAGLDDYVARLSSCFPWKAAIVEYVWLHQAVDKMRADVLRLLDTHDIQHKRVTEFASRGMSFPLRISRGEETRIFEKFDAVIAIQATEAALIREMCPQRRVIIAGSAGTGIGTANDAPEPGRILYVGGYNGANIDGLRRFLIEVWPRVRSKRSQINLRVCGHVYRAFLGECFESVTFAGHKESLESEYAEASVIINPVWIGTGLKIKTVEALARAKPLVTTTKGIEGLPESVLSSAWIADDDAGFADALIRLSDDQSARQALSQSAAEFARVHLNKQAVYRELFDFLEQKK